MKNPLVLFATIGLLALSDHAMADSEARILTGASCHPVNGDGVVDIAYGTNGALVNYGDVSHTVICPIPVSSNLTSADTLTVIGRQLISCTLRVVDLYNTTTSSDSGSLEQGLQVTFANLFDEHAHLRCVIPANGTMDRWLYAVDDN